MEARHKMAITGVGLVSAGIALSLVGVALIAPAVLVWTVKAWDKGTGRLLNEAGRASKTVGTVAGTLQRSFGAARKAGIAEIRKSATGTTGLS